MKIEKLTTQELSNLEQERAQRLLTKLRQEATLSKDVDWFCNGHNKITKDGMERYNAEADTAQRIVDKLKDENIKSGTGPIVWYCNGHSK